MQSVVYKLLMGFLFLGQMRTIFLWNWKFVQVEQVDNLPLFSFSSLVRCAIAVAIIATHFFTILRCLFIQIKGLDLLLLHHLNLDKIGRPKRRILGKRCPQNLLIQGHHLSREVDQGYIFFPIKRNVDYTAHQLIPDISSKPFFVELEWRRSTEISNHTFNSESEVNHDGRGK